MSVIVVAVGWKDMLLGSAAKVGALPAPGATSAWLRRRFGRFGHARNSVLRNEE